MGIVISLCDLTGNMVAPWAADGYECWIVDLAHRPGEGGLIGGIRKVGADVNKWRPPLGVPIAFVAAAPPCDHMAVSGARWFRGKGLRMLAHSIEVVASCAAVCEASGAPFMIEHPVSTLATYWRAPDHRFDPCEYAGYADQPDKEAYTKRTCLWTGGGFIMPPVRSVPAVLGSIMHRLPPSPDRAKIRSATPTGFARAVWHANRS